MINKLILAQLVTPDDRGVKDVDAPLLLVVFLQTASSWEEFKIPSEQCKWMVSSPAKESWQPKRKPPNNVHRGWDRDLWCVSWG